VYSCAKKLPPIHDKSRDINIDISTDNVKVSVSREAKGFDVEFHYLLDFSLNIEGELPVKDDLKKAMATAQDVFVGVSDNLDFAAQSLFIDLSLKSPLGFSCCSTSNRMVRTDNFEFSKADVGVIYEIRQGRHLKCTRCTSSNREGLSTTSRNLKAYRGYIDVITKTWDPDVTLSGNLEEIEYKGVVLVGNGPYRTNVDLRSKSKMFETHKAELFAAYSIWEPSLPKFFDETLSLLLPGVYDAVNFGAPTKGFKNIVIEHDANNVGLEVTRFIIAHGVKLEFTVSFSLNFGGTPDKSDLQRVTVRPFKITMGEGDNTEDKRKFLNIVMALEGGRHSCCPRLLLSTSWIKPSTSWKDKPFECDKCKNEEEDRQKIIDFVMSH